MRRQRESDMLSRRRFLGELGGTALLPALPSLFSDRALADGEFRKRFIVIYTPNGQAETQWYPSTVGLVQRNGYREGNLRDIQGRMSDVLGPRFDRYRNKMTVVRGLDHLGFNMRDHWPLKILSGHGEQGVPRQTIDQIIARSSPIYAGNPRFRTLHLRVAGPNEDSTLTNAPLSCVKLGNVVSPVLAFDNPRVAFDVITGRQTTTVALVDLMKRRYDALTRNSRLSTEDKHRLESHYALLDDLQMRLNVSTGECGSIPRPDDQIGSGVDPRIVYRNHTDILAMAIRCGITQVATIEIGNAADARLYEFLNLPVRFNFHDMTHKQEIPGAFDGTRMVYQWFGDRVCDLLDQLDVVEDQATGRTYLDNSIVYWGSELGVWGPPFPTNNHASMDMPVILFGDGGNLLRPGRYLDYREIGVRRQTAICDDTCRDPYVWPWRGRPYNELLIGLMKAYGVRPEDWETSRQVGFGSYADNVRGQYVLGDRRSGPPNLFG